MQLVQMTKAVSQTYRRRAAVHAACWVADQQMRCWTSWPVHKVGTSLQLEAHKLKHEAQTVPAAGGTSMDVFQGGVCVWTSMHWAVPDAA